MISTFDNCLYIHIPKTAGQSIESVFLERAGLTWQQRESMLLKPNSVPQKGPPRLAHLTAQEYIDYGYLSSAEFHHLFRFTFVRNPWDRLVSEYRYKQHKFSFKDFVFKHFPKEGNDDYKNGNGIYRHVMPQHQFLFDHKGNKLVDFIGKFENLAEDFALVSEKICKRKLSLPHINKTTNSGLKDKLKLQFKAITNTEKKPNLSLTYQDYYDDETKEFIGEFYAKDIELFNYQF